MRKGLDLIDLLSKIMLGLMAGLFVLSFFVGPILLFVGFGFFFVFPVLESVSTFFYKWLYRNIIVAKGFLDEEADTWEKFKWRIIKVVDFKKLPKVLHEAYMKNVDENYRNLIRDKRLDKINQKFRITWDGEAIPAKPILPNPNSEKNLDKKQIEYDQDKDEYEEDIEENQVEEVEI